MRDNSQRTSPEARGSPSSARATARDFGVARERLFAEAHLWNYALGREVSLRAKGIVNTREHLESLFCDSSGFDNSGRSLTTRGLFAKLKELIDEHGPIAVATGEQGQFQVHLEVWKAA